MLAGAAAMLTACSSEEPFVPNGAMTEEIANADTYALISLAMPEANGTRAAESVTSGVESEYKVANGTLLLWKKGATEADAEFVTSVDFTGAWNNSDALDITREATIQLGFAKGTFESTESYAGMVVLNYDKSTYPMPKKGDKFGTWKVTNNTANFTYVANGLTYLTMTSSPQYVEDDNTTFVLVDIPHTSVKTSYEELSSDDVIDGFYVHRNAAKISVTADGKGNHVYDLAGAYAGATVTVNGWAADVKAIASFPVQNHDGLTIKAGWLSNDTKFPSFKRVHWGKSAFYGETYDADNYSLINNVNSFPSYEYVKENTLKYDEQVYNRTTRVVLKAKYSDGTNTGSFLKVGNTTTLLSVANFVTEVNTKLSALNIDATAKANAVNTAGYKSLKDMVKIEDENGDEVENTKYAAVALQLGLASEVAKELAYYVDGNCYYAVRIRHFDDQQAPLGKTIETADDYDEVHEGRYGVLRNNWYEVTVGSISKIGAPSIPEVDNTPDDAETDEADALSVSIKMLNWAKRSQNVNL